MECFDGQTHLMIANESFWRGHLKNDRIECQVDGDELQQTAFLFANFFAVISYIGDYATFLKALFN